MAGVSVSIGYGGVFLAIASDGRRWSAATPAERVDQLDAAGIQRSAIDLEADDHDHGLNAGAARAFLDLLGRA